MKKVLITSRSFGSTSPRPMEILEEAGFEITHMGADFNQERFEEAVSAYDALIIGAHPFPRTVMARCKNLKIIAKHGAGLDNIDLEASKDLGIKVTNVPAMNANAVADLAFGHMLNLSRGISRCDAKVRQGEWKTFVGTDVHGKVLGLLGFGAIAKNVAKRATGFDMKVLAYDPFVNAVPEGLADHVELVGLDRVLEESDFLSIHIPLNKETRYLLDEKALRRMKRGAYLINTGRGGIVQEADLFHVLKEGHLAGAAMDVAEQEPINKDNPLLTLENVVVTPHIGMYSLEAINAVSVVCAENVARMAQGIPLEFEIV